MKIDAADEISFAPGKSSREKSKISLTCREKLKASENFLRVHWKTKGQRGEEIHSYTVKWESSIIDVHREMQFP